MNTEKQKINIHSIYTLENNKHKPLGESFHNQLQFTIRKLPHEKPKITLGNVNVCIGKERVPGIKSIN